MSGVISRWLGGIEALPEIAMRLLRVQIENRPAVDVIRLYDGEVLHFYCDPPYLHDTRGDAKAYGFEMTREEHVDLAEVLHDCKGKAALSGYRNGLMDKLYKDWRRYDAPLEAMSFNQEDAAGMCLDELLTGEDRWTPATRVEAATPELTAPSGSRDLRRHNVALHRNREPQLLT